MQVGEILDNGDGTETECIWATDISKPLQFIAEREPDPEKPNCLRFKSFRTIEDGREFDEGDLVNLARMLLDLEERKRQATGHRSAPDN